MVFSKFQEVTKVSWGILIMRKEKPQQLDFFNIEEDERPDDPAPVDERWRLEQVYEKEAGRASLNKGESIGKSRKKNKVTEGIITRGRKKIGIHKKRDQEEINN